MTVAAHELAARDLALRKVLEIQLEGVADGAPEWHLILLKVPETDP